MEKPNVCLLLILKTGKKEKQQPNEDSYMNSLGFIIDTKNYNKFTVTVFPLKSFFCLKI